MARGVDKLKTQDDRTTFLCLSNSNSVFISTILEVRIHYHRMFSKLR